MSNKAVDAIPIAPSAGRWVAWFIVAISVLYIASCGYESKRLEHAFSSVKIGDAILDVERLMGHPSVREQAGESFPRYANQPCQSLCVVRLWYENRLTLDSQAWSLEVDAEGKVIKKSRWVSP